VTDAVLLPEHAPSIPAARIAREFFDETLGRSSAVASLRLILWHVLGLQSWCLRLLVSSACVSSG